MRPVRNKRIGRVFSSGTYSRDSERAISSKGYRGMLCKCSRKVLNGVFKRKKVFAGEDMG
jgi:hypothetical protein